MGKRGCQPLIALGSDLTGKEISRSRHMPLLPVRTQIKSIISELGTRSLLQSVAPVMPCSREGCPGRE